MSKDRSFTVSARLQKTAHGSDYLRAAAGLELCGALEDTPFDCFGRGLEAGNPQQDLVLAVRHLFDCGRFAAARTAWGGVESKAGGKREVLRRRNVDQIDCAGHDDLHLACWLQTSTAEVIVDGATFYGATCSQITTNNNQRLRTGYQKWLVSITAAVAALLKKSDARNSVLRHFGSRPPTTPPWRLTRTSRLTRSATTNFSIGTHERLCRLEYITADPEQPSEPCYDHGRPL